MTRAKLSSSNRTEVSGAVVREILFVKVAFSSGAIRYHTGDKDYVVESETYVAGPIAGVDSINENQDRSAEQATLTIGGCDATLLAKAQLSDVHWSPVLMWLGYVDADHNLVDAPIKIFDGYLGAPTVQTSEHGSLLSITCETVNALVARTSQVRASNADQVARGYATDTIFNQVGVSGKHPVAVGNWRHEGLGNYDPPTNSGGSRTGTAGNGGAFPSLPVGNDPFPGTLTFTT